MRRPQTGIFFHSFSLSEPSKEATCKFICPPPCCETLSGRHDHRKAIWSTVSTGPVFFKHSQSQWGWATQYKWSCYWMTSSPTSQSRAQIFGYSQIKGVEYQLFPGSRAYKHILEEKEKLKTPQAQICSPSCSTCIRKNGTSGFMFFFWDHSYPKVSLTLSLLIPYSVFLFLLKLLLYPPILSQKEAPVGAFSATEWPSVILTCLTHDILDWQCCQTDTTQTLKGLKVQLNLQFKFSGGESIWSS